MKSLMEFSAYIKDIVLLAEQNLRFSNEDPERMIVCVRDMEMLANGVRAHRVHKLNEHYRTQRGKSK